MIQSKERRLLQQEELCWYYTTVGVCMVSHSSGRQKEGTRLSQAIGVKDFLRNTSVGTLTNNSLTLKMNYVSPNCMNI
jgi:hypothetical protein